MDLKHRLKTLVKAIYDTNLEIMSLIQIICVYIITLALVVLPLMLMYKYNLWDNLYTWIIYGIWITYAAVVKIKYNKIID